MMKKLNKKIYENRNTLEQYKNCACDTNCQCYCGPGGYPWASAKESLRQNQKTNIDKMIIS